MLGAEECHLLPTMTIEYAKQSRLLFAGQAEFVRVRVLLRSVVSSVSVMRNPGHARPAIAVCITPLL